MHTDLCGYIIGRVFYSRKVLGTYGVKFFLLPVKFCLLPQKKEGLPRNIFLTGVRKTLE